MPAIDDITVTHGVEPDDLMKCVILGGPFSAKIDVEGGVELNYTQKLLKRDFDLMQDDTGRLAFLTEVGEFLGLVQTARSAFVVGLAVGFRACKNGTLEIQPGQVFPTPTQKYFDKQAKTEECSTPSTTP